MIVCFTAHILVYNSFSLYRSHKSLTAESFELFNPLIERGGPHEDDLYSRKPKSVSTVNSNDSRYTPYAAVRANISTRFASVIIFKHTLIKTLNAAMVHSLLFSDSMCKRTRMDAIGSSDANIDVIHDVIVRTIES